MFPGVDYECSRRAVHCSMHVNKGSGASKANLTGPKADHQTHAFLSLNTYAKRYVSTASFFQVSVFTAS